MKKPKYKNRRFYCCETRGRRYKLKMLVPSDGCCKDSLLWDSEKEYTRWCELKLMEKKGFIQGLQRQVKYDFQIVYGSMSEPGMGIYVDKMTYVADFKYQYTLPHPSTIHPRDVIDYSHFEPIVEDVKGYLTREYKKKKKLMEKVYGIVIKES